MEQIGAKLARLRNNARELEKRLLNGWEWLRTNRSHDRHREFEDEWLRLLGLYETTLEEIHEYE